MPGMHQAAVICGVNRSAGPCLTKAPGGSHIRRARRGGDRPGAHAAAIDPEDVHSPAARSRARDIRELTELIGARRSTRYSPRVAPNFIHCQQYRSSPRRALDERNSITRSDAIPVDGSEQSRSYAGWPDDLSGADSTGR